MSDVQNKKQKKKKRKAGVWKERHGRYKQTHMELLKIKNIIYEVKNTLDGINKKLDTSGKKANELEDMVTETNLEDRGKKRTENKTENKSACCNSFKWSNTQRRVPEGRNEGQRQKKCHEKVPQIPNLMKTINLQINSPSRRNMRGKQTNKNYTKHIIIKVLNSSDQEKPLKQPEKKNKNSYIEEQM